MLRAVLDANVIAGAFICPQGPSGRILKRFVAEKAFALVLSAAILDEVRRCLRYPRLRKYLSGTEEDVDLRVASLGVLAHLVEGTCSVKAVLDDPDDDKYIAAALEGQAVFIVSGDRHLLKLREWEGIRILRPREFLDILERMVPPRRSPGSEES